jgi:hypothetical protein
MRGFFVFFFAFLFFSCGNEADKPVKDSTAAEDCAPCDSCRFNQYGDTLFISYGYGSGMSTTYSECEWLFSAHCEKIRKKPAAAYGNVKPWPAVDKEQLLPAKDWDAILAVLPADTLRSLDDRYIPPGFADGVVEWLAVSSGGKTKQINFAWGQEPAVLGPVLKLLREISKRD